MEDKTKKNVLCIKCRSTFSIEELEKLEKENEDVRGRCPECLDSGIPANTDDMATLTLTHHEWRILFIWANNWGQQCDRTAIKENTELENPRQSIEAIEAIAREVRKQAPDLPALSIFEEIQQVADKFDTKAVVVDSDGQQTEISPRKLH